MSDYYWGLYKFLNTAPGEPKELKCVGCKVAAGGTGLAASIICLGAAKRGFMKNQYKSVALCLAAFCFTASSTVIFRLAYEHDQYNKNLIKNNAELVRKQRRENSQHQSSSLQHSS